MSRLLTSEMQAHLASEVTTLCTCWKITRRDGEILGFTDLDRDVTIGALDYIAASGFTASSVASKADFAVDNLDIEGILSSEQITEPDILAGLYDYAEVEIFMVNYEDLSMGTIKLKRGYMGEVRVSRGQFVAELRGLAQHLSSRIGRVFLPTCDAVLGDARCGVTLASFEATVSITEAADRQTFRSVDVAVPPGYYTGGEAVFLTGDNAGLRMEIKEQTTYDIVLALPMPRAIAIGDSVKLIAGCDKTRDTCKAKFDNLINFRGFADIPGMDAILKTAGTSTFGDEA